MPGFAAFQSKFKKAFNVDVQIYAPYEYDAVRVLVEAMNPNSALMLDTRQARGDIRVPSFGLRLCWDD